VPLLACTARCLLCSQRTYVEGLKQERGLDRDTCIYKYRLTHGALHMTRSTDEPNIVDQISSGCLLGHWRRVNRVLSGIYEAEMRDWGLKSSQLSLLVAVAKAGPVRRIDLGKRLHLDPSTLTRNLKVMLKQGWIDEKPDEEDQRSARLKITPKGRKLLENIAPAWKRAQSRARQMLGSEGAALVLGLKERASP
jgi:DNA-binding MarR family transcriptional regulator